MDSCKRGGVRLAWSNAGERVYADVEEEGEEEEDVDDIFDQIAKGQGSQVSDESQAGPAQPQRLSNRPVPEKQVLSMSTTHFLSTLAGSC